MFPRKLTLISLTILFSLPVMYGCQAMSSISKGAKGAKAAKEGAKMVAGSTIGVAIAEGAKKIFYYCPENVICEGNGKLPVPVAGYRWDDGSDPKNSKVHWSPGISHPSYPNIKATENEKFWTPKFGYKWSDNKGQEQRRDNSGMTTEWTPDLEHPTHKNILTSKEEDYWIPKPGYIWSGSNTGQEQLHDNSTVDTQWMPELAHPRYANILASEMTDYWIPKPGYTWSNSDKSQKPRLDNGTMETEWTPGIGHPRYENVLAINEKGKWKPSSDDYVFQNPEDSGDLTVVQKGLIHKVYAEHGIYQNEKKGMLIHVDCESNGLRNSSVGLAAYFYLENGQNVQDLNIGINFTPDSYLYRRSFTLFLPYDELHELGMAEGKYNLSYRVKLHKQGDFFAGSKYHYFTYNSPGKQQYYYPNPDNTDNSIDCSGKLIC